MFHGINKHRFMLPCCNDTAPVENLQNVQKYKNIEKFK